MSNSQSYVLIVNGEQFTVNLPSLQGVQIRAVARIPNGQELVVEGAGMEADRLLRDEDVVSLESGPVRIFTKPPTTFGAGAARPEADET